MKAAVIHAFGQPPRFEDFPEPTAGEGEVGVNVRAAGLHGLPDFSIKSDGADGGPITLEANKPGWKIIGGGSFLLEVLGR